MTLDQLNYVLGTIDVIIVSGILLWVVYQLILSYSVR
jgi:hypothetical protein